MEKIKQRLLASSALLAGFVIFSPVYQKLYRLKSPCSQKYHQPAKSAATTYHSEFDRGGQEYSYIRRTLSRANHSATPIGMAISPDGREIYRLTKSGILVFNRNTGESNNFDLPLNFPRLSRGTDLAYDSRRDLVSLVSLGGEGYLYRFDAQQRRWLDVRSLDNIDLKSLTYERTLDRYVAQVEDFGMNEGNLVFITGNGELLQQETREGLIKELY